MTDIIPGVHVAVHTHAELLHKGASCCGMGGFKNLGGCGVQLWKSSIEIMGLPELPGLLRVPCMEPPCFRCSTRQGGFRFPMIGIWTRAAVLAQLREQPSDAWTRYHGALEPSELLQIRRLSSGLELSDLLPGHVQGAVERLSQSRDGITLRGAPFMERRSFRRARLLGFHGG